MIKRISLLGCGWLGLPLGEFLLAKDLEVKGSTTHSEKLARLKDRGIQPYLINMRPHCLEDEIKEFLNTDLLIVNIPPSVDKNSERFHIERMESLYECIQKSLLKKVIYIGSTSVYPDLNKEVTEEDVIRIEEAENKTLFAVEEIFRKQSSLDYLIIRCAGLAGYDRNLVKHFAGRENLKMGNAPVNLIHRDAVIGIIYALIQKGQWNDTYNISAPLHPLRRDLYPAMAEKYGYATPQYDRNDNSFFKTINTDKIQRLLQYNFKFPDPCEFYYTK